MNLEHVFWLGGSPCAGKSTVAERLAKRFDLEVYHADEHYERHCGLATPSHPTLYHISRLSDDDLWLGPVEKQFEREVQLYREEFDFVLEDLRAFNKPVIAEGAALLPERVISFIGKNSKAIWLVPSEEFQRHHYAQREWAKGITRKTSDPQRAFENWMQRDARFALEVKRQAQALGLPFILVDGTETLGEVETRVVAHFNLA